MPLVFRDTPLSQNQPAGSKRDTPPTGLFFHSMFGDDSDDDNVDRIAVRSPQVLERR